MLIVSLWFSTRLSSRTGGLSFFLIFYYCFLAQQSRSWVFKFGFQHPGFQFPSSTQADIWFSRFPNVKPKKGIFWFTLIYCKYIQWNYSGNGTHVKTKKCTLTSICHIQSNVEVTIKKPSEDPERVKCSVMSSFWKKYNYIGKKKCKSALHLLHCTWSSS